MKIKGIIYLRNYSDNSKPGDISLTLTFKLNLPLEIQTAKIMTKLKLDI